MSATQAEIQQFQEDCDQILDLLKQFSENYRLADKIVADLLNTEGTSTNPFWPPKPPRAKPAKKEKKLPLETCHRATRLREMLEFLERRRILMRAARNTGLIAAVPNSEKDLDPLTYSPWIGYPHSLTDELNYVTAQLVRRFVHPKQRDGSQRPPLMHISPVMLANVERILNEAQQALRRDHNQTFDFSEIVRGIVLKITKPKLWENLYKQGFMLVNPAEFITNATNLAKKADAASFQTEIIKDQSRWLRVGSYWNGLPPFHGLYIEDCDWIHVGPFVPNVDGKLKAYEVSSYRIRQKYNPKAFQAMRDALVCSGLPNELLKPVLVSVMPARSSRKKVIGVNPV